MLVFVYCPYSCWLQYDMNKSSDTSDARKSALHWANLGCCSDHLCVGSVAIQVAMVNLAYLLYTLQTVLCAMQMFYKSARVEYHPVGVVSCPARVHG